MPQDIFSSLAIGDAVLLNDDTVRVIKSIKSLPIAYFTDGTHCFRQAIVKKVTISQ